MIKRPIQRVSESNHVST